MSDFYRPQRSWGKVMFLQGSVILLTGGSAHPPPGADTQGADTPPEQTPLPPEQTPPMEQTPPCRADTPRSRQPPWSRHTPPWADTSPWEQSMLGDTVNARAVRILLECSLVLNKVSFDTVFHTYMCVCTYIYFNRCRTARRSQRKRSTPIFYRSIKASLKYRLLLLEVSWTCTQKGLQLFTVLQELLQDLKISPCTKRSGRTPPIFPRVSN